MKNTDLDISLDTEEAFNLEIRIGDYLVKRIDTFNIVVQMVKITKEGENAGSEYFVTIGYYKTLYSALEKVLRLGAERSQIKTIKDTITTLKEAESNLLKVLKEDYPNFDKTVSSN